MQLFPTRRESGLASGGGSSNSSTDTESTPGAELSNGGRTVKKTGANGWNCNVLASRGFSSGVHEWAVAVMLLE